MSEMTAGVVVDVETEPAAGLEPAEVAGEGTALNASDIAFEGGLNVWSYQRFQGSEKIAEESR